MISGYENDLYNDYLSGWNKEHKHTSAENGLPRTETIWMNYDSKIEQLSLNFENISY
jgi:DNA adenine methylase